MKSIINFRKFTKAELKAINKIEKKHNKSYQAAFEDYLKDLEAEKAKKFEIDLIALRVSLVDNPKECDYYDPFLLYQDGELSKRKLIEYIAKAIVKVIDSE